MNSSISYIEFAFTFLSFLMSSFNSPIHANSLLELPAIIFNFQFVLSKKNPVLKNKDWELFDEENGFGRIWINDEQYFDNIPLTAWEFYIGGYQPAQKWLKDRKGRKLEFEDKLHYQKIIVALTETDRIMNEIDKIEIE